MPQKEKVISPANSFNKEKWKRDTLSSPTNQRKFRWHDGQGRQITAGGLLPYDDEGIWVVGEKKTKDGEVEWTDPGGKYKFEDCDIYTTISREFSEELYYSTTISREAILQIKDTHIPTYVNGHQSRPVYICYTVHISVLEKYGVKLDADMFLEHREKALSRNPDVPPEYYSSVELKRIKFDEIESSTLSYRLKRILKYGSLLGKMSAMGSLNRSTSPNDSEDVKTEVYEEKVDNGEITTSPISTKALYTPIIYDIEKVCVSGTFPTTPTLIVGGKYYVVL